MADRGVNCDCSAKAKCAYGKVCACKRKGNACKTTCSCRSSCENRCVCKSGKCEQSTCACRAATRVCSSHCGCGERCANARICRCASTSACRSAACACRFDGRMCGTECSCKAKCSRRASPAGADVDALCGGLEAITIVDSTDVGAGPASVRSALAPIGEPRRVAAAKEMCTVFFGGLRSRLNGAAGENPKNTNALLTWERNGSSRFHAGLGKFLASRQARLRVNDGRLTNTRALFPLVFDTAAGGGAGSIQDAGSMQAGGMRKGPGTEPASTAHVNGAATAAAGLGDRPPAPTCQHDGHGVARFVPDGGRICEQCALRYARGERVFASAFARDNDVVCLSPEELLLPATWVTFVLLCHDNDAQLADAFMQSEGDYAVRDGIKVALYDVASHSSDDALLREYVVDIRSSEFPQAWLISHRNVLDYWNAQQARAGRSLAAFLGEVVDARDEHEPPPEAMYLEDLEWSTLLHSCNDVCDLDTPEFEILFKKPIGAMSDACIATVRIGSNKSIRASVDIKRRPLLEAQERSGRPHAPRRATAAKQPRARARARAR